MFWHWFHVEIYSESEVWSDFDNILEFVDALVDPKLDMQEYQKQNKIL